MPKPNIIPFRRPPGSPAQAEKWAAGARHEPRNRERRDAPEGRPALTGTFGRRGLYGLGDIARLLAFPDWTIRTITEKLRILARDEAMPLPVTPRIVNDAVVTGPASIHAHSRWDADLWDAWKLLRDHGRRPGDTPPPAAVPPPLRAHMARIAEQIGRSA